MTVVEGRQAPREEARDRARTLIEALPYIRTFRGQTVVIKVGGAALDDDLIAPLVAEDVALMVLVGIRIVVVHGGGPQVTQAMTAAGLEARFEKGLRVTDEAAMEVVRRVLVGSVNPQLVARLSLAGLRPVGLSGFDGALLNAAPAGPALGRVGRVVSVQPAILDALLADGYTPVVAPIAPSPDGLGFNVNADAVAGALAGALHAAKLIYLTDVEGLYRDMGDSGSLISEIKLDQLRPLVEGLSAGMRPKIASAVHALEAGVGKVHMLDGRVEHALLLELFTDEGIGTQVLP